MAKLQALIFDVDGTLADTERDGHRVAFNRAFAAAGLDWQWSIDLYGELLSIAGGKERIRFFLDRDQPQRSAVIPAEEEPLTTWIAALHNAKTQHYRQLVYEGIMPLRPGVQRLITSARQQNLRLAIATTSRLDNVIALLQTTLGEDSPDWFDVIAAGDIVPHKKPAPDIYLYALQQLGLTPADCLAIEDSDQGCQAARQAGLTTVITTNGYTQNHDFTGAAIVINHLGEPDQPFQVLQGDVGRLTYFDVALANQLITDN